VTTVTITNGGVSPANVQISRGGSVRFVNQSSSQHQMASDPHPIHTNCPPINQVPFLNPGQSGQTGAFTTPGTCGYHDHLNPTNGALQGTIQVNP
jgi:plastocyanin